MQKIYVVEDDLVIAQAIQRELSSWGYQVECCRDFENVLAGFTAFGPQLVLLDISLPFFNGYHWCQKIREQSTVPILFISSASDKMDVVMAMNMGGDDFISKPFDLDVLVAKINAIMRRAYAFEEPMRQIVQGEAALNLDEAALYHRGERVELTKNEYRILLVLMERRGKIVSRDQLMARLWETDQYVDDNTLTVNVARLRKKLEAAGLPSFIQTKKGLGYTIGSHGQGEDDR